MTRFLSYSGHGDPTTSTTGNDDGAGSPTQKNLSGFFDRPTSTHVITFETYETSAGTATVEWTNLPAVYETVPDKPPLHLGEPLDAGDGKASEAIAAEMEPIDIGPLFNVDDPFPRDLNRSSRPPGDIGQLLNADFPEAADHSPEVDEPIAIGPDLDADAPWNAQLSNAVGAPIEIGAPLNAGAR
jgi:hypothetical protein